MSQYVNKSSNNDTPSYSLSTTVIKAFSILEFIGKHQPVQPSQIVKGLHLTRANVHRLLATFISIGYVHKQPEGYGLTFKLFQLGSSVPLNKSLRDVAKPIMNDLEKIAEENIYLNVLTTDSVVAIDEVKSPHHVILNPDVTYMFPIYACASGKVLVSDLSDHEL
ncbi:MAG: helix-turn-helix domain-containing protein, partial [Spirochaetales bacterium]|nr:helix-turn-helix domain-containing protein [Spirochaetales bacterium]